MTRWLTAILLLVSMVPAFARAQPSVEPGEWAVYRDRFVRPDGRVSDDGNSGISHSEGQGYGMLLAYLAGNRADFERIWTFTRTELLLRNDGLAAWKWEADATPNVTDPNNAADGDLLIAYALARAGDAWHRSDFIRTAGQIARSLGRTSIYGFRGLTLLRPGVDGFDAADRDDGPVINLSYWVFEAFPLMAEFAPRHDWAALAESGTQLIRHARFGPRKLPPDWLALGDEPQPAEGFPAEFGYNALRIPLYLVRSGSNQMDLLRALRRGMTLPDNDVATINVSSGAVRDPLADAGYRIIPALLDCVIDGTEIPPGLKHFDPTLYYPATLHLLALSHLREARPSCL